MSITTQVQAATASATQATPVAAEPSTSPASSRELSVLRRDAGFIDPSIAATPEELSIRHGIQWSRCLVARATSEEMLTRENINGNRAKIRRHLVLQAGTESHSDFAFKIPVNAALREGGDEA